jgi:2-oxoglutarate dehydrogenase E2 component (dihydrolipoamide succinyltransferase)
MSIELKVPPVGESINEVEIGEWLKKEGAAVGKDEPVAMLESEKASIELLAPEDGVLGKVLKATGEIAAVGDVVALLETGGAAGAGKPAEAAPVAARVEKAAESGDGAIVVMPAAERALADAGLKAGDVQATGPGGRLLKEDVLRHTDSSKDDKPATKPATTTPAAVASPAAPVGERQEETVRMSPLRRTIARRLVEAQQSMAMLTTFNEVDMTEVMALRKAHQEAFIEKHGLKVGFMSFFVKAVVEALKSGPELNAEIRDDSIVYRNYFDIGVAIGGGKGLVVPVLRNAERMGFADVERSIGDFAKRAQSNKLLPDELTGGTFTISNGGVYGSLLSTPIVNPPQCGVLGMHTIQQRPVAIDGEVVIRPMMYLALSYDHRVVDGKGAVTFLKHVKELIESPARMLLEV